MSEPRPPTPDPLREVAWVFIKLGTTAFGGPAAHIALMEHEVVRRRQWLTRDEFLDLLGATNLIPGPNSTELAIHLGHRRAGWPGLLVAGLCFIVPAMLITLACAWAYVRYGARPQAEGILYAIKPVIIVIILQALWTLGRSALKTPTLIALAASVAVLHLLSVNELALLLFAATVYGGAKAWASPRPNPGCLSSPIGGATLLLAALPPATHAGAAALGLAPLFLFFLKVGSVLYGSGYVLLAFLRSGLVEGTGWLTETQLLDAVAVGQFTPGPVFTTATFIGYLLAGTPGALVATAGIFLPAFFFVAISGPIIPRIRRSPIAGACLDAVNAASLALMAVVTGHLTHAAIIDLPTLGILATAAVLLLKFKLNPTWLILAAAALGATASLAGFR